MFSGRREISSLAPAQVDPGVSCRTSGVHGAPEVFSVAGVDFPAGEAGILRHCPVVGILAAAIQAVNGGGSQWHGVIPLSPPWGEQVHRRP